MYQKRQNIAKKIAEIAENKILQQEPEKFKKEMDYYQEEYRKITYEIRVLDPTLEEYQEMIKTEKENKEFSEEKNGVNSEIGFSSGYSKKQDDIDDRNKNLSTESKAVNIEHENDVTVKNALKDIIDKASICLNQDYSYKQAEEYIQSAEDMLAIYENERNEAKGNQNKVSNDKLDRYMDKNISGKSNNEISEEEKNAKDPSNYEDPYTLRKECNDTKVKEGNLNKKLELKERLKKVNDKYNQLYETQKENEKDNIELIRKY